MVDERPPVLDANILIRAVLGRRVRQVIEDNAPHASFFAPEVAYDDARHYLPSIVVKRGGSAAAAAQALVVLEELRRTVHPVPGGVYESHRADALSRIELRDPDDWPILADRVGRGLPDLDRRPGLLRCGSAHVDHGPGRDLPPALGVTDRA